MLIRRIMTKNPIFIHPDMPINDVRSLMDKEKIGHLPVLDRNNILVGLVAKGDLLRGAPSAATSLDIYEISYLLTKMTVKDVMEKAVVTVGENEVIEEAARIMADRGIGCLPVMRGSLLVGIITDTDLFHVFINAFGARHLGIRLTCSLQEKPGQIARLTNAIAEKRGNLVSFVTSEGDDLSMRRITLKVTGISRADLEFVLKGLGDIEIEDIRE